MPGHSSEPGHQAGGTTWGFRQWSLWEDSPGTGAGPGRDVPRATHTIPFKKARVLSLPHLNHRHTSTLTQPHRSHHGRGRDHAGMTTQTFTSTPPSSTCGSPASRTPEASKEAGLRPSDPRAGVEGGQRFWRDKPRDRALRRALCSLGPALAKALNVYVQSKAGPPLLKSLRRLHSAHSLIHMSKSFIKHHAAGTLVWHSGLLALWSPSAFQLVAGHCVSATRDLQSRVTQASWLSWDGPRVGPGKELAGARSWLFLPRVVTAL